jgi:outer membrane protein assembly factor BamB
MLGVMLGACVLVAALRWGQESAAGGQVEAVTGGASNAPQFLGKRWDFQHTSDAGLFVSTPLVAGDRIYAAAAHPAFKVGTLFCIDRNTGKEVWNFIDDGLLKQMLSSPCLADGRIYLGEGFHDDPRCKLYCIDAATGKKLWEFQTTGQTESSPAVAAGKVYVGGGNDGLYCLDAPTGKKLWQFSREPGGRLQRFGAGPTVAGGRVYCGSGVDRNEKQDQGETALFCLDADSGKLLWKTATTLPCWGAPVVRDGVMFIGLGNGDVFNDAEAPLKPAGQVLCLDAATGKELWRRELPNGVIGTVAVDVYQVYAGCRDGRVYCLGRTDGQERWHAELGSPVIATPALALRPPWNEQTAHVFAIASKGKIACLEPHTGQVLWAYTLDAPELHLSSSPRVVVTHTAEGDRRQIYFGAGIGGLTTGRPVVFCLEDLVAIPK